MKKNTWKPLVIGTIIGLILIAGSYIYNTNHDRHLIWSRLNMRWIWVDKDGRP